MTNRFRNSTIASLLGLCVALSTVGCSTQQGEPEVASNAGCSQLEGAEETLSAVYRPGAIYDAQPIKERVFKARANQPIRTMGASLYVQASPEMNAPYLRRVLSCHAASDHSGAHASDPLRPTRGKVAELQVREAKHGFAIDVKADDHRVGEEIWSRAQSLTEDRVSVQQVAGAEAPSEQL